VAKRNVQVGQRVAAGAPLMSVIALDSLWVDANFKEVQLRDMRIGQPATLVADVYGDKVVYHGTVAGLSAGTGAAFALLPAQNATGNWIKVVQRVPVRIALDEKELRDHPLRVGLSMEVEVDVSPTQGDAVSARKAPNLPAVATALEVDEGSPLDLAAREWVQHVIAQHLGRKVAPVAKASSKPSGTSTGQGA
jgi:membrane fusion protein (multidrug efflux system)